MRIHRPIGALTGAALGGLVAAVLVTAPVANGQPVAETGNRASPDYGGLTSHQRAVLYKIAKDTWAFYGDDVDPNTHLPLDNLGPGNTRGT